MALQIAAAHRWTNLLLDLMPRADAQRVQSARTVTSIAVQTKNENLTINRQSSPEFSELNIALKSY
jgi:hypothetical protein